MPSLNVHSLFLPVLYTTASYTCQWPSIDTTELRTLILMCIVPGNLIVLTITFYVHILNNIFFKYEQVLCFAQGHQGYANTSI